MSVTDTLIETRWQCEAELNRLGLTWKSPRVKLYIIRLAQADGRISDGILADLSLDAMRAMLKKLRDAE
jgi:hypothetical protein